MEALTLSFCNARTRSGGACRNVALHGKQRCCLHGGASTGAKSLDGKQRQAEGRAHYLQKLRGEGHKPGPAKGTGGRPRKDSRVVAPIERLRLDTLAMIDTGEGSTQMPKPPPTPEEWQAVLDPAFAPRAPLSDAPRVVPPPSKDEPADRFTGELSADIPAPPKPTLTVSNPAPELGPPAVLPSAIVEDTSRLAAEVEDIAQAAIERIKELLKHPFDSKDPNFAALLRFLSSTYNTSMTTIARTDDNRLKRQAVSKLDYILERAAEERRKRDARSTIEGKTLKELHDTRPTGEVPHDDAS